MHNSGVQLTLTSIVVELRTVELSVPAGVGSVGCKKTLFVIFQYWKCYDSHCFPLRVIGAQRKDSVPLHDFPCLHPPNTCTKTKQNSTLNVSSYIMVEGAVVMC